MKNGLDLSIIIPLYNEQDSILSLHKKIKHAMSKLKMSCEIVFVDDGSTDRSLERLKALQRKDKSIRIIVLRKNFGQSAAINAGFSNAKGNVLIVIDADLQNDPEDIPRLLAKMDEGYDVVSGWRDKRQDPLSKTVPSRISNWLHRKLTGLDIHDSGCSLKAYKKESVNDLELYGEMHRYIPALIAIRGFKIGEIKVKHNKREYGKSKYGIDRLLKGFLDLLYIRFLMKYGSRPLHFFGLLGLFQIILGVLIGVVKVWDLYRKYLNTGQFVQFGPLLLFSGFLIIIGILFVIFGFLAELTIRIYYSRSQTKDYIIREILQ